ncbi:DUF2909 family protein [Pseudoalteromonas obscura]|uniref:DUF2909 family protein n=1 Tax=Pseudoalteromonas obscura TaxID=3048491 RepID=A0ABT7EPS2_9GAMM|nr:DUF2909 family protein [Pseudoalteromonas sp. P94(2023)]MDK2597042.1 DUF2909 family protein [Pseudoalteromonas sp. P94(2023)]
MLIKWIITALLLVVLFHLFHALIVMLQGADKSKNMSQLLGKRVLYSLIVILCITLSSQIGFINFNPQPITTTHTQIRIDTTTQHQQSANTKQQPETQNVD